MNARAGVLPLARRLGAVRAAVTAHLGAGGFSLSGISIIAIRIAGAGLGLAAQALASRLIGAGEFGYYALALVWLLLLGHGATVGTNQLVCRFLAAYREAGDRNAAAGLLRFALAMALGAAVLTAVAAAVLARSGVLGLEPQMVALATLAFAAVPLLVLQDYLEAIARGLDRPSLGIGPAILLRQIAIIVGVVTLMVLGEDGDAMTVMAMTIAGLLASIVIQFALLIRPLRRELAGAKPAYRAGYWFRTAIPNTLVDMSDVLFNNADILVLGLFMPPEIVAFYFAATRLSQILSYVPYGMSAATAQKYAALAERGDRAGLQRLISASAALSTVLAVCAGLALTVLAGPLLNVFGAGFDAAAPIVPLLCLGIVLVCALGPGEDVLTMLGHERACSAAFTGAVIANLALNFALVPALGMTGAAIATATALGLRGAVLAVIAHRRLGLFLPLSVRGLRAAPEPAT